MSAIVKLDSDRLAAIAPAYEEITDEQALAAAKACGLPINVRQAKQRAIVGQYLAKYTVGEMLTQAHMLSESQMEVVTQLTRRMKKKATTIDEIAKAAATINETVRAWGAGPIQATFKGTEVAGAGAQNAAHAKLAPRIEAGLSFVGNNNTYVAAPGQHGKKPEKSVTIETTTNGEGEHGSVR